MLLMLLHRCPLCKAKTSYMWFNVLPILTDEEITTLKLNKMSKIFGWEIAETKVQFHVSQPQCWVLSVHHPSWTSISFLACIRKLSQLARVMDKEIQLLDSAQQSLHSSLLLTFVWQNTSKAKGGLPSQCLCGKAQLPCMLLSGGSEWVFSVPTSYTVFPYMPAFCRKVRGRECQGCVCSEGG